MIFLDRAAAAMHDAVRQDADVRILIARNFDAAAHAARKHRKDGASDFLERGVVVAGGDVHRQTMRGFFSLGQTTHAMTDVLLNMVAHMRWADTLVADALQRTASPSADAVRLFAHIAVVEELWYSRIEGVPMAHAVWPDLSVDDARAIAERHADLFERLVNEGDATLRRAVSYRNSAGRDFRNTVEEIVTHVTMHGSYHRGQIARIVRASGGDPPYTDYIQFMRRDQLT